MTNLLVSTIAVMALILANAAPAIAAGGCPEGADRLETYASCLTTIPGYGARYRGTAANLDEDHQQVMAMMSSSSMVPPQNHNGLTGVMTTTPYYYPIGYSMGAAVAYVAASHGHSPAAWYWLGMYPLSPLY